MSLAAIVRALVDAGATPQMILAAVEAAETSQSDALQRRRDNDAERQRRRRHVTSRDVTVTDRDGADPLSEAKVSPAPPSKTQPISRPPSPPSGAHGSPVVPFAKPNGFDRFWEAYPRKVGKGAARKSYERAVAKLRGAGVDPLPRMLGALAEANRGWDDPQFIPHPATWLDQERWDDEPDVPPVVPEFLPRERLEPKPSLTLEQRRQLIKQEQEQRAIQ